MLDNEIKEQLKQYLNMLEAPLTLTVSTDQTENGQKLQAFIEEVSSLTEQITIEEAPLERTPSFSIAKTGEESRITFAGIPLGHEFTSFVLALLQVSGRPPKIEETVRERISALEKSHHFETYVSLSCHNCPDIVQALNIMSVLNPKISHTMIDGAFFKEEAEAKDILAVPAVYQDGVFFSSGRSSLEEILTLLEDSPTSAPTRTEETEPYDVLIIGGGPAGASAAVYAARKGIRTGVVAESFGGQITETLGIENIIGIPNTEGPRFAAAIEEHVKRYSVDLLKYQRAASLTKNEFVEITLENGTLLKSKTAILATGARWRMIGVPGEEEFKNKGVAYCPHCDGPLFEGKEIAVVGGGNSGIEAAIDLAGIVKHVTVLEFMPELSADTILKERLASLPNVTVLTNVQTKAITGDSRVKGLTYLDRETKAEHALTVEGVFVLIGLVPNTEWLADTVDRNTAGEIIVDKHGATSLDGVFAAGDCTDSAYKQIVISMGSGATAALGAFDYLIRH
ncbi:alkyl hydroperoxide reductase, F subunit [Enterococcus faecalis 13-SD-W-01]|nr:alkyl hydroperoxide reductase, F subunit [Enterococcus faecalis 13-SD-W-01]